MWLMQNTEKFAFLKIYKRVGFLFFFKAAQGNTQVMYTSGKDAGELLTDSRIIRENKKFPKSFGRNYLMKKKKLLREDRWRLSNYKSWETKIPNKGIEDELGNALRRWCVRPRCAWCEVQHLGWWLRCTRRQIGSGTKTFLATRVCRVGVTIPSARRQLRGSLNRWKSRRRSKSPVGARRSVRLRARPPSAARQCRWRCCGCWNCRCRADEWKRIRLPSRRGTSRSMCGITLLPAP